jgi:hypothetical protein
MPGPARSRRRRPRSAAPGRRSGQRAQHADAADLLGGKQLHHVEPARHGRHQLGRCADAGHEGNFQRLRRSQQIGRRAGTEREVQVQFPHQGQIAAGQYGAESDDRFRHRLAYGGRGGGARLGAQRDLQRPDAAGDQGAGQRHGAVGVLDRENRNQARGAQQVGNGWRGHEASRMDAGEGMALLGMMAPR